MIDHRNIILAGDVVSFTAILGAFAGIIPPFAAFAAAVWYVIQIWESDTVRLRLGRARSHRSRGKHFHRRDIADPPDIVLPDPPKVIGHKGK